MSKNPKRSEVLEADAVLTIDSTAVRVERFFADEGRELVEIIRENCKNYDEMRYMAAAAYRNAQGHGATEIAERAAEFIEKEIAKALNHLLHEPFPNRGEPPKGKTMSNAVDLTMLTIEDRTTGEKIHFDVPDGIVIDESPDFKSVHIPHHVISELEKAQEQENERKEFIEKSMSDFAEFIETAERGTVSPMCGHQLGHMEGIPKKGKRAESSFFSNAYPEPEDVENLSEELKSMGYESKNKSSL